MDTTCLLYDEPTALPRKPSIDIQGHAIPDTMLVALIDRPQEMKDLVQHNPAFFQTLASHLDQAWPDFQALLYLDRHTLSDQAWTDAIAHSLASVPSLLQNFKSLVGYLEPQNPIRPHLHRLQNAHPVFFDQCRRILGDPFLDVLYSDHLDDASWEARLFSLLSPYPELLDQLQDILSYELDE